MPSSLKINFSGQHKFAFRRLDPMQPMDLGDGPEKFELNIKIPPESAWDPLFGDYTHYTGHLFDGSTLQPVFVKWARSKYRMQELIEEGDFYCSELRKLQGVVVPKFYGYYNAVNRDMGFLGCMILELMDDGNTCNWKIDHRSKLEAAYRLHAFGISHSGLDKARSFMVHGNKVFILDFSEARKRCGCEISWERVRLCKEMKWMEQQFGDGQTNRVLEEIGVPPGWRVCLNGVTEISKERQMRQQFAELALSEYSRNAGENQMRQLFTELTLSQQPYGGNPHQETLDYCEQ